MSYVPRVGQIIAYRAVYSPPWFPAQENSMRVVGIIPADTEPDSALMRQLYATNIARNYTRHPIPSRPSKYLRIVGHHRNNEYARTLTLGDRQWYIKVLYEPPVGP